MSAPESIASERQIGDLFEGGYYAGRILVGGAAYALIVAPADEGAHAPAVWAKSMKAVNGAGSFYDGRANTDALAAAGSTLAKWARSLSIAGFDDWYLPSRDELEMLYRAFKPTPTENWCWRGDNPSSIPAGYAYSPTEPAQTAIEAFRVDGGQAFRPKYHWSSTQYAGLAAYAWAQYFGDGGQGGCHEGDKFRARAVRRLTI